MNAKFFDVKKAKQDAIINAALKVFLANGYKKASTDVIVQEAGISKGLLFHYFISKKGLYEFICDYSVKYMSMELTRAVNKTENDFFKVQVQIERARNRVMKNYPHMQQFINSMRFEKNADAVEAIGDKYERLEEAYSAIYCQTDNTKFLDKVDVNKVIDMINWMSDGFVRDKFQEPKPDLDEMNEEFEKYLLMLRRHFYRSLTDESISIAREENVERDDSVMEQMRFDATFEDRLKAGKKSSQESADKEKSIMAFDNIKISGVIEKDDIKTENDVSDDVKTDDIKIHETETEDVKASESKADDAKANETQIDDIDKVADVIEDDVVTVALEENKEEDEPVSSLSESEVIINNASKDETEVVSEAEDTDNVETEANVENVPINNIDSVQDETSNDTETNSDASHISNVSELNESEINDNDEITQRVEADKVEAEPIESEESVTDSDSKDKEYEQNDVKRKSIDLAAWWSEDTARTMREHIPGEYFATIYDIQQEQSEQQTFPGDSSYYNASYNEAGYSQSAYGETSYQNDSYSNYSNTDSYGVQSSYASTDSYGAQSSYANTDGYGAQSSYAAAETYNGEGSYQGEQGYYGSSPQDTGNGYGYSRDSYEETSGLPDLNIVAATPVMSEIPIPADILHTTAQNDNDDDDDEPWSPRPVRQIRL